MTEASNDNGETYARVEARLLLRSGNMLSKTLPAKNGQVRWTPAAAVSGGMLSRVNQAMNNFANATVPPLPTVTAAEGDNDINSDATININNVAVSTTSA